MKKLYVTIVCVTMFYFHHQLEKIYKILTNSHPIMLSSSIKNKIDVVAQQEIAVLDSVALPDSLNKIIDTKKVSKKQFKTITNLIEAELAIVGYLLNGNTGMIVEQAIVKRNELLSTSSPEIVDVYNYIMNDVTQDQTIMVGLHESVKNSRSLLGRFNSHVKKQFLTMAYEKLVDHRSALLKKQS